MPPRKPRQNRRVEPIYTLPGPKPAPPTPIDVQIALIATRQHGVVTATQLLGVGLSRRAIQGRTERGTLIRVHNGVYAVGHAKLSDRGQLLAVVKSAAAGAFLSHRTAASLRGLRPLNLNELHVTVRAAHAHKRRAKIVMHRTRSAPQRWEVGSVNGLPVSSVPRLLIELAQTESEEELDRLITLAVRKRILTHDRLEQALKLHATRHGVSKLSRVYAAYRPRPERKSTLESAFDDLLRSRPEIPEPQRNVYVLGWEVDCYWPQYRLALELDGRGYHQTVKDIERDRLRDAKLLANGIRPLRVTDQRFEDDKPGVLADLIAAMAWTAAA